MAERTNETCPTCGKPFDGTKETVLIVAKVGETEQAPYPIHFACEHAET